jgi:hypothetical protein
MANVAPFPAGLFGLKETVASRDAPQRVSTSSARNGAGLRKICEIREGGGIRRSGTCGSEHSGRRVKN